MMRLWKKSIPNQNLLTIYADLYSTCLMFFFLSKYPLDSEMFLKTNNKNQALPLVMF